MTRETDYLIQSLFERESLDEMTLDELRGLSEQYPFSSVIQFLYSCKLKTLYHLDFPDSLTRTALFFDDPFWLDYQLSDEQDMGKFRMGYYEGRFEQKDELLGEKEHEEVLIEAETKEEKITATEQVDEQENILINETASENELTIPIEPYHTVDYFASQGIKLSIDEQKDELGKKVKSFTAWLKTMKRLQPEPENLTIKDPAVISEDYKAATDSGEPIVTEAMAEVYLKQGLTEKAIEIYQKLSLQNPANSHIFASRISLIKENNI